jgi:BlaI family penicillinase repressor
MSKRLQNELSKRERQVMDVIYRRKKASVKEVLHDLPSPPSYSAVRATLNILEKKGFLRHKRDGKKYVYVPVIAREKAMTSAARQFISTYFNDSVEDAVAALIDVGRKHLSEEDYERLSRLIRETKQENEE